MTRLCAILFGIIFICMGSGGFLPAFVSGDMLFGLFKVSFLHNVLFIATGVFAIMAATSFRYARLYFQIFGVFYTVCGVLGFWRGHLFIIPVNTPDNLFHLTVGIVALLIGFKRKI